MSVFVFVGSNEDAESWIGPETQVIDLEGGFVTPGFYDLHVHPDLLWEPKYTGQLNTLPLGPEELKQAILEYDAENPGDGWIFGGTWEPAGFAEAGVEANAEYLDGFISHRPVGMLDATRHNLMVNTKGMEVAGMDRDTFEPDHGTILRDDDGNPAGLFSDGAQSLLSHVLPHGSVLQLKEAYREGQEMLNKFGFVAARSQHVNTDRLKAVQLLERNGELTVRYDMAISWKNDLHLTVPDRAALISGERHRYSSKHVNANYIKFHYDGQPFSKTAVFLEPYKGTTDWYGKFNENPAELRNLLVQLERQGLAANIHAIGDSAARAAFNAIEDVRRITGTDGPRHMLAHSFFLDDADAPRIAELNIAAEFGWNLLDPEKKENTEYGLNELIDDASQERLLNMKPVLDSGGKAVFGSDLVVISTVNIFPAMSNIIDRDDPSRTLTVEEALLMLTLNGAWAMSREHEAGSIEVGKYADFVLLDRNWFEIEPALIADTKVLMTIFEGRPVHELQAE